jgi:ribosomal protein S18 acetylase RimI-like enzyme
MSLPIYCKRLRMEADLRWLDAVPALPPRFVWVPWDDAVLPDHADVKYRSFQGELDARLFPNLATHDGCVQLMESIRGKPEFLPAATWLVAAPDGCCATVQGVRDDACAGAIQNLGVVPEYRGRGLGRALLLRALHAFRLVGLKRARLEVSARNRRAVRLYHEVGFIATKTLYRELTAEPEAEYSI